MATISEALATALDHHQSGQLQAAEQIYRQILTVDPGHADAWHLLGAIAFQTGKHEFAIQCIRRAIDLNGTDSDLHNNLGNALRAQGKLDEAVACFRRALELRPDDAVGYYNLGIAFKAQGKLDAAVGSYCLALELRPDHADTHSGLGSALWAQGKLDEAVACLQRALQLNPDYAEAISNLGNVLKGQGKLDEAVACFRRALELKPEFAIAHYNLGTAFQDQRKLNEAVTSFRRALALKPDLPEAQNNLGNALYAMGMRDEAASSYRRALELNANHAEAHCNLGSIYKDQRQLNEAVACFSRALALKPNFPEAQNNLGIALQDQGKTGAAIDAFCRALELKPDYAEAISNWGNALKDQGRLGEAVACFRRALELKPDFAEAWSNLLLTLQYQSATTVSDLSAAHAEYERQQAAPLRSCWRQHENDRDAMRRLRVGFVSPDFCQHPVAYFLIGVLENLERGQCETVCYSDRRSKDALTARLEAAATTWRDVTGLSDQELAEQICADRIDILFDLAGHTAGNRLLVFARKPAPIQVTWAGYVGTTGLAAMDYILADRFEIPAEAEAHYCERVLRMPDGYVVYDPPIYAPGVSQLPAEKQGYMTFGSFNNRAKITSQVIELWAKILGRVQKSRLVLKHRGTNDGSVADGLLKEFAKHGIDPRRVECLGWSPHANLLAEYHRIDLALDPFPYNGGLTTCEALWMGVPVITCPGETFASRHSLSHLSNVGLTETIARDLDDYVELAVSLANDLPRLGALRAGLRERMAVSPLCDGKRFADNLMRVLRDVWREWCYEAARSE